MVNILSFPLNPQEEKKIREHLFSDETLVYPTETYYAVGCLATSTKAVKRIYKTKKRERNKPLLVLVDSWDMLEKFTVDLAGREKDFLKQYWPGPLTAILKPSEKLSGELNRAGSGVGFRMTSSLYAQNVVRVAGVPVVGTSCNISGGKECSDVENSIQLLGDQVSLFLDGGVTPGGLLSTVIDLQGGYPPKLIREGAITIH